MTPSSVRNFSPNSLRRGYKISSMLHEGVALPGVDFDRMVKTAAGILTSRHICRSLGIDSAEAHHRFGSPA